MIEIDMQNLPVNTNIDIVSWCLSTFGPCKLLEWTINHSLTKLYISEKNYTLFALRWL